MRVKFYVLFCGEYLISALHLFLEMFNVVSVILGHFIRNPTLSCGIFCGNDKRRIYNRPWPHKNISHLQACYIGSSGNIFVVIWYLLAPCDHLWGMLFDRNKDKSYKEFKSGLMLVIFHTFNNRHAGVHTQLCGYWWPVLNHQAIRPHGWVNIYCIWLILCRNITFIVNNIKNNLDFGKKIDPAV